MSAPTPPPSAAPQPGQSFNLNTAKWNIFDKIALGAGALFFIFSFMSGFVHASFGGIGRSGGSAWSSWGWLGTLLVLAAIVLIALKAAEGLLPSTLPWPLIIAGAAGAGLLIIVIRAFTYSASYFGDCSYGGIDICGKISVGPGWSAWFVMILGLIVAAATIIPLTSAAGSVEAKLNDVAGQVGNKMGGNQPPADGGSSEFPPPPAN